MESTAITTTRKPLAKLGRVAAAALIIIGVIAGRSFAAVALRDLLDGSTYSEGAGVTVTERAAGFKADLPAKPKVREHAENGFAVKMWSASDREVEASVAVTQYAEEWSVADAHAMLESMAQSMLTAVDARLVSSTQPDDAGDAVFEFTGAGKSKEKYRGRLILDGQRIYTLIVTGYDRTEKGFERLTESFETL